MFVGISKPSLFTRRDALLDWLAQSHPYDIAIVGGGATGLGVALDGTSGTEEFMAKPPKEPLLEHERFELRPKSGEGLLSYEVWGYQEKDKTVVTRYNLAYINHSICHVDNGRVLGFNNAHAYY